MNNNIPNRQAMCEALLALAENDQDIVVLCSDSRGSASLNLFAWTFPEQFVEVGIAEQNLVGIAAGLARCGKKPFVASPACFLTMRAIEQIKVDVAYSGTNVKLIGISAGVSYGALGMSHHSLQDLAVLRAIPGIDVFVPADRFETKALINAVAYNKRPGYIRLGRNPVPDIYTEEPAFTPGKAICLRDGRDLTIVATGETVSIAMKAACLLETDGVASRVLNIHTIKPLDTDAITAAARETGRIISLEEHSVNGGLGGAVAEVISQHYPVPLRIIGLPDEALITGNSAQVFAHYGLTPENIRSIVIQSAKAGRI